MRRTASVSWWIGLFLGVVVVDIHASHAVIDDGALCPGTGVECVVSSKITVTDPQGIDITHPFGNPPPPPLTLHIKAGGALIASNNPVTPLTIRAGKIIVDKGGSILGNVAAATGNTLTLIASDAVTIEGTLDVSAQRLNNSGGDGGSIAVTSPSACEISGKLRAVGARSTSVGGGGGDISFDCGNVTVLKGASFDASASGPGASGGNISLNSNVGGLSIAKGVTLRAIGAGLDGGSVSLSTSSNDLSDPCVINGKISVDALTVATTVGPATGAGGNVDISCGGDVSIVKGAVMSLSGGEGGGGVDVFAGGDFVMENGASMKLNATDSTGGSVDIVAGNNATVAGTIEARSGGTLEGNDGAISVTNDGDLVIAKGAVLDASSGRKDQQAGQITLAGAESDGVSQPLMVIEAGAVLKVNGFTAGLGTVDVDLSGSQCAVDGTIQSDGQTGDGIAIGLLCDSVSLGPKSLLKVTTKGGTGGSLSIDTTGEFSGTPGSCTLSGKLLLRGTSGTGADGTFVAARGGTLDVNCGAGVSVPDRALIDVGGSGAQSVGGQVTVSGLELTHIGGTIKAKAAGALSTGGRVAIAAPAVFFDALPGSIDVSAQAAGVIEASATDGVLGGGVLQIAKPLNAKGSAFGGNVVVSGCSVSIDSPGWLRADGAAKTLGSGGVNEVHARNDLTINGKMTAVSGINSVSVNATTSPALLGTIQPLAQVDHSLTPCP